MLFIYHDGEKSMAIQLEKKEQEGKTFITLTNGHLNFIENVRQKYRFANQAQALDFVLKAVGATDEETDILTVNGVPYTPEGYDGSG